MGTFHSGLGRRVRGRVGVAVALFSALFQTRGVHRLR